ncbi:2-oxo acid dehydrogenase E1 subunit alpha [Thermogymnomonas acidicola]|uniref:2-oxo acid dehydrogenase E1 subunit alpha n=1 Tax=Thermogymnomonas acidicola TaxID=399579 RepID=A0AA37BQ81_9ARCH|nr:thiamine pyrophosphate-dependent dehydrogenase E1 component subunit alpha [Thermogymnomonas acidicola]GGM68694.1 2-oxo acid dehydrogenase E1 subunit alpha [Thermogymnomonas acidicola]
MSEVVSEQEEKELFVRAYSAMVLGRTLDKKIMTAQRQGRVGFYVPSMGQEATQAGLGMALRPEDRVFQYYRDITLMIYRGVDIDIILNQIFGNARDLAKGRQMPSHLMATEGNFFSVPSPVGTNLPLAVGSAYARRYRKLPGIVAATFGDGASSTPDFHAAMNFASVYNLPVLFVCENNRWAISLPYEKQSKVEVWKKAEAYGMPGAKVDGNDFIRTYRVCREAVEYVRSGRGPYLVEAVSYRMGPHSTSDDPSKYRDNAIEEGSDQDPLVIAEKSLIALGYITKEKSEKLWEEAKKLVDSRFEELEKVPAPEPRTLFDDVYKEMTWNLKEEMEEIL